jgi:hypothetical protein
MSIKEQGSHFQLVFLQHARNGLDDFPGAFHDQFCMLGQLVKLILVAL